MALYYKKWDNGDIAFVSGKNKIDAAVSNLIILVTGSRHEKDFTRVDQQLSLLFARSLNPVMHVGDAPGIDSLAIVAYQNWFQRDPVIHKADWSLGKAAGPLRNKAMVAAFERSCSAQWRPEQLCIAFPSPSSKGTWDCVRRALVARIPIQIVTLPRDETGTSLGF